MSEKDFKEQDEKIKFICENVSELSRLLQVGEECAELAADIFKYLRKFTDDNPTPKSEQEILDNIKEEITDVMLCVDTVGYLYDPEIYRQKLDRWYNRLKESEAEDDG